jgi:hypothetical protein
VTLRHSSASADAVIYEGELASETTVWNVRVSVILATGAVEILVVESKDDPPDWLANVARTTLRTAWRSAKTGTPWPRRVSRWRGGPSDEE